MSWTERDLPDLSGRTAVVTGANSGIGLKTAKALAEHGAHVVLACRKTGAGREAAAGIDGSTEVAELDLASLDSVRRFAEGVDRPVDLLVNNAGVMTPPRYRETADGFELQYGTNHLGHVALTARLLPRLLEASAPRVVSVSSIAHHAGDESVLQGNPAATYRPDKAYGNSKLADLLFALELQRRAAAAGSPLTATAAHPGVSATGLVTSRDGLGAIAPIRWTAPVWSRLLFQSATAGARPTLYAATVAEPGSYTGSTWLREARGPVGPARLSRCAQDQTLASRLWDLSLEQVGLSIEL
ncbi:oxidoreductase [Nocardioides flavescens]|uniref:SDR family NAD(P)-dependent oxidoreductase n=1 Tax=Nocardioides flavescens TaxID=2691959 RepID=A0A6L7EU94_9ACTN|nr:SDR family NAD(P)-dependent oxidoreductase [Nocardioides flavescens]